MSTDHNENEESEARREHCEGNDTRGDGQQPPEEHDEHGGASEQSLVRLRQSHGTVEADHRHGNRHQREGNGRTLSAH